MSSKRKFIIKKSVFQVKYRPNVMFYDQMYSHSKLFSDYPHWETDRLRLLLKNFDKKQSIVIKYDSIGYETDDYKISNVEEFSKLASQYLTNSESKDQLTRLGYRTWALCEVDMSFEELKSILNLKFLNNDFIKIIDNEPSDMSLSIIGQKEDLNYRLFVGPMKNIEVPNFIQYNVDSHIDPNSIKKYDELASIHNSYPKVSLYMDLDIYKTIKHEDEKENSEVELFFNESQEILKITSKNLIEYIFGIKI